MKRTALAALVSASMTVGGCNMVLREVRYPGGYPGYVLDKRTFDASENKSLQLLRASILVAMAARVGESNVDAEDADAFAKQISDAVREVNHAAFTLGYGDPRVPKSGGETKLTLADGAGHELTQEEAAKRDERKNHACSTLGIRLTDASDATTPRFLPSAGATQLRQAMAEADYGKCGDYYVNFEASISRIEARVIRAMLTALSTDQARKFLDKVGEGDVLGALVSLLKFGGSMAGSFHRGAGVYRSGVESLVAGLDRCDFNRQSFNGAYANLSRFNEWDGHTLQAAACLGLSRDSLFEGEEIAAQELAHRVRPGALHAMLLIARQSCVGLPLANPPTVEELVESRKKRKEACDSIIFDPIPRTLEIPEIDPEIEETIAGVELEGSG
jgi:hypothetical protein